MENQADRVTFGETIKISLETCGGNKYEFRDIFVSYSTDVGLEETLVEAMKRAATFVKGQMETEEGNIRAGGTLPTPETMGNEKEIADELRVELDALNDKDPELVIKAHEYLGEHPWTKEKMLKALKSAKAYNEGEE